MGRSTKTSASEGKRRSRPASTPEAREQQMIGYADALAEKQLREGTASPSVIVHYLKLGSSKNQLELEKLKRENELLKAKTDTLESAQRVEELYSEALKAFTSYSGGNNDENLL